MRSRGQSGFTLFEIMIVFVIIGLVMVLAIPALDRASPKYALRAAAREVAGTINAARGTAIGKGKLMGIGYDLDRDAYRLYGQPADGARGEPPFGLVPLDTWNPLGRYVRFVGIEAQGVGRYQESGVLNVRFDPTIIDGSHVIHLENSIGQIYSVKYNAFVGTAEVLRDRVGFEEGRP
ncbi:MAG: pilus assembly FimT family protein [Planctomycetota bacterium]|jgi:prepilin-type N-terminal cleavage/methylation domain-containing protein